MQEDRLSSHVPRTPGAKGAARNTVVDERPERPEVRSGIAARGGPGVEYQTRVLVEDVSGQRGEAQAIHEPLGALKTPSELASCERGGSGFAERGSAEGRLPRLRSQRGIWCPFIRCQSLSQLQVNPIGVVVVDAVTAVLHDEVHVLRSREGDLELRGRDVALHERRGEQHGPLVVGYLEYDGPVRLRVGTDETGKRLVLSPKLQADF